MNFEDEVIEVARASMNLVPEMEKLLRTVYRAGYNECLRNIKEKHNKKYSTVDSNEKASAFMEARLWEFIDMAAMWPKAKPDSRIWDHVLVYAPKKKWVRLTDEDISTVDWKSNETLHDYARAIEIKLRDKNA